MSFIRGAGRFARQRRGTTAVIFASALFAVIPAVGFVVDHGMYINNKSKVQNALDFASIATAKYVSENLDANLASIETVANDFFKGELLDTPMLDMHDVKVARMGMRLNLDVDGTMPTSFMHLAGVETMSLYTDAEVVYGIPTKMEVALVLDTSKSMNETDPDETVSRIASLRSAAQDMVDTLMVDDEANIHVKMSLVPFSNRINVGTDKNGKSWLSVPDDMTKTEENCHIPDSWYQTNCVERIYDCEDDGEGSTCSEYICPEGAEEAAVPTCTTSSTDYSWYGCVQPRTEDYHLSDGNYFSQEIPGFLSRNNNECASRVEKMTSDPSRIKRGIRNMQVRSETYIPSGLMWGYRTLTRQAPFRADKSISDFMAEGGTKAIVLMSDGANTLAPEPDGSINDDDISAANPNTKKVCQLAKDAGVEIYVVAYNVSDLATKAVLENCASSDSRFYEASSSDALNGVFETIAKQLARDISLSG